VAIIHAQKSLSLSDSKRYTNSRTLMRHPSRGHPLTTLASLRDFCCTSLLLCGTALSPLLATPCAQADSVKPGAAIEVLGENFRLPSSLEELPLSQVEQGQLLVSARTRGSSSGFPTFNALLIAGTFPGFGKSAQEQGEAVAASYRLVGLADTKLLDASSDEIKGFPLLRAHLSYGKGTQPISSRVAILGLLDKHLILTWTAPRERETELLALSNAMLKEINPPHSEKLPANMTSSTDAGEVFSFPRVIEVITAGIILIAGALVLKRRLRKEAP
jgi:hypothetical protein